MVIRSLLSQMCELNPTTDVKRLEGNHTDCVFRPQGRQQRLGTLVLRVEVRGGEGGGGGSGRVGGSSGV